MDAVLHGHGPGSTWAQPAAGRRPGDASSARAARCRLAEADWLLALTDESGLPAVAALAEAPGAGRPIRVLAEIADDGERYPLPGNAEVRWLTRDGRPAGQPELLIGARSARADPAPGRASATCSASPGRSWRCATSWPGSASPAPTVYAKGYWNLQLAPAATR